MGDLPTVAVLGAGRMGAAMVRRLRTSEFPVVVWNRTPEPALAIADATGAQAATSPKAATADAEIVISSLADDGAVRAVYLGDEGACAGLREGATVLEMSTIDPRTVAAIAPAVAAVGATLLDAPVSGSVSLVEQGTLTVMAGGSESSIAKAQPVLDALAARVFHVGSSGAGATMKLAVNAVVHAVNVAVAEALVLAEKAGVERSAAYEVIANSAVASPFITYKEAAFLQPDETPTAFSLDLVAKDLDLILGLADRVGVTMEQGSANRAVAARAIQAGLGKGDMTAVARLLRS